jgi:esterase/lipase superfamily enzyme
MHTEYHRWYSHNIGHDMEMRVYGHYGRPLLVFPCAGGRHNEFEDFGMLDIVRPWVEAGQLKIFCIDSIDNESLLRKDGNMGDNVYRHEAFDKYVVQEVVPFIREHCHGNWKIALTGNSMGAYHSVNFLLRHPDVFDACIALAGVYSLKQVLGDYWDQNVYYNSPVDYLPNLNDGWFVDQIRQANIIICTGQGPWEYPEDTWALKGIFEEKRIPATVDLWGHDVDHDWPWWKIMLPNFLPRIL